MNFSLTGVSLPVRLRPDTPMTDEELMRFCAANEGLRIEREANGDLLLMTPAGFKTGVMNMRISRILGEWAEADGRGEAVDSSGGFTLPDGSMRAADAAWVAHDRLKLLTAREQDGFAPICPDFVIELRSPSDKLPALKRKMVQWIAQGVVVGWLIDPKSRTVTIYMPGAEPEELVDPSSVQGRGPVTGFELVMKRVWG
jgi:Uma2 family endonuclease